MFHAHVFQERPLEMDVTLEVQQMFLIIMQKLIIVTQKHLKEFFV